MMISKSDDQDRVKKRKKQTKFFVCSLCFDEF